MHHTGTVKAVGLGLQQRADCKALMFSSWLPQAKLAHSCACTHHNTFHRGEEDLYICMQARRNLEASLLTEAEMVFTTLSSTGRQAFQQAAQKAPFHTGESWG